MIKLKVKKLKSLTEKSIGLLKYEKPIPVFFETRFGIHTFFLKFPIDVLILNENFEVVSFKKNLNPNHIYFWKVFYDKVIELPAGEIDNLNIRIKSQIEIFE